MNIITGHDIAYGLNSFVEVHAKKRERDDPIVTGGNGNQCMEKEIRKTQPIDGEDREMCKWTFSFLWTHLD